MRWYSRSIRAPSMPRSLRGRGRASKLLRGGAEIVRPFNPGRAHPRDGPFAAAAARAVALVDLPLEPRASRSAATGRTGFSSRSHILQPIAAQERTIARSSPRPSCAGNGGAPTPVMITVAVMKRSDGEIRVRHFIAPVPSLALRAGRCARSDRVRDPHKRQAEIDRGSIREPNTTFKCMN